MKYIFWALCLFFTTSVCVAQTSAYNEKDSLLNEFFQKFRRAMLQNDIHELSDQFEFPIFCSYCDEQVIVNSKCGFKITRTNFPNYARLFLLDSAIKNELQHVAFQVASNTTFEFSFHKIRPSESFEGLQLFFVCKKIAGKYKIVKTYSVP